MGTVHKFRRTRHFRARSSWGAAAREIWPALVAIPLAVVSGLALFDDRRGSATRPSVAFDLPTPFALPQPTDDLVEIDTSFARCEGPVRDTCVVDGDTIWLDGAKIRIADIDTPEVSDPACPVEAALGERATARLTQLLNAAPFALAPNPDGRDEDPYGRKLRVLTRNGDSLGEMLVAEGLAQRWGDGPRDWC